MNSHQCMCGYPATSDDDYAVHLGEAFIPADDTAPDGRVHAEAAGDNRACVCGFRADSTAGVDAHLLAMFTPPDGIGADGQRHA